MGVTIDEILVGDEPETWEAAGYTVDDDGTCRIGQVRVRLVGRDGGKRILGWSLRGAPAARLADGTLDGIPTTASDDAAGGARHPPERVAATSTTSCCSRPTWPAPSTALGVDRGDAARRARQRHLRRADAPGVLPARRGDPRADRADRQRRRGRARVLRPRHHRRRPRRARVAARRAPRRGQGRGAGGPAHRHAPPPRAGHERGHGLHDARSPDRSRRGTA